MSKQRPYGTFEEAFIFLLNIADNKLFEEFMQELKGFDDLDKQGKVTRMRLPAKFLLNHTEYVIFWQCLSRMYGEMFANPVESYVYTCNLNIMIFEIEKACNAVLDDKIPEHDYNFEY